MEGRLDMETSNRPCGRITRSLAFAAMGKGEAWTRRSKGPKPLRRTPLFDSPARRETPTVLNPSNRRIRTRMYGRITRGRVTPWGTFTSYSLPAFLAHSELGQKRKCPGSRGTSVLPSGADIVSLPRHVSLVTMIGIGGRLAAPPLPHHRTYGSVYGGSRSYAN